MLTVEQQFVLELLRSALGVRRSAIVVPEGVDAGAVAEAVRRGGILLTVFPELKVLPEAYRALRKEHAIGVAQNYRQVSEGGAALEALGCSGMRCMGLKGWVMRGLYPRAAMRQMTDVDILIKPYSYEGVCEALDSLGFEPDGSETADKHDLFHNGVVTVEAHKRLTDDSGFVRDWEARMWERAVPEQGGVCSMSDEDRYVFHFVHMHRDFRNGWFGLRRIMDAWLLDQGRNALDMGLVDAELKDMGIAAFRDRMVWLGRVAMGEESADGDAELLLDHAFRCGIYGTDKSYKAGRMATMSRRGFAAARARSIVSAVFLPFGRMKAQFPVLEKYPVLLPACWARRIARYLTDGKIRRYKRMLDYSGMTGEDVDRMRRILEAGRC